MPKALVIGGINTDILFRIAEAPKPDSETRVNEMHITQGGSAANVAVWLSRLGTDARLLGCVGDDYFGDKALRFLGKAGVDLGGIWRVHGNTGVVVVLVLPKGERSMLWHPGANLRVNPEIVKRRYFKGIGHLHITSLDGRKPIEALVRAKEIALKLGIPVSVDPGNVLAPKGIEGIRKLIDGITYVMPSRRELGMLTGIQGTEAGARCLLKHAENVVVKMGGKGSFFMGRDSRRFTMKTAGSVAMDTTGAGDAFAAGFINARLRSMPIKKCLGAGHKCAEKCIAKLGAV